MNLKKTVAIAAAAGALAAISVPAMAFENEFHGLFNGKFYLSNIDNAAGGYYDPTAFSDAKKTSNYFEQRARLQYTAKASNDLKLVTQFELDSTFGGNGATGYKGITTGNNAGQLDADSITLETKHVYLNFNAGPTNVSVGILPYKDAFKGIFLDADVSAIATSTKIGDLTLGAAFSRVGNNPSVDRYNDRAIDAFLLDSSYALSKNAKVGMSYYFLADYTGYAAGAKNSLGSKMPVAIDAVMLHTLGLNADAKFGALNVSGFAAMQMGHAKIKNDTSAQFHGYALNAAAKMAVGPGTAKTALLFTSGDEGSDKHINSWQSPLNSYNESGMMILNRNTADDGLTTDMALAWSTNNNDHGQILYTLGYDATLSPKTYVNGNAGMLWVAKSAGAPVDKKTLKANASDLMATELNVEAGYKLYDNLTVKLQAAYAILGGYYKNSATTTGAKVADPENPYTIRTGLSYVF